MRVPTYGLQRQLADIHYARQKLVDASKLLDYIRKAGHYPSFTRIAAETAVKRDLDAVWLAQQAGYRAIEHVIECSFVFGTMDKQIGVVEAIMRPHPENIKHPAVQRWIRRNAAAITKHYNQRRK